MKWRESELFKFITAQVGAVFATYLKKKQTHFNFDAQKSWSWQKVSLGFSDIW